jgi:nicotinate-nucleotide adenylyltransferase
MVETTDINQAWFVVSPQNPLKKSKSLAHEFDRLDMVEAAIHDNYTLSASNIEFSMPRPSYTVDTMAYLSDKYPEHEFVLIIGEDNLGSFPKWKNHRVILEQYGLYVYPRPDTQPSVLRDHKNVKLVKAPMLDISATFIRDLVRQQKSIQYIVPDAVADIIKIRKLYQ